jgi:hypothetical protein
MGADSHKVMRYTMMLQSFQPSPFNLQRNKFTNSESSAYDKNCIVYGHCYKLKMDKC